RDIEPHLEPLFRAAYRLTRSKPDAEELVQETCIRAIRAIAQVSRPSSIDSIPAWLMRVQYNLYIDGYRRRQRSPSVARSEVDPDTLAAASETEPEQDATQSQRFAAIDRAMSKLTPDQQALMVLRVEGYTLDEMCAITGIEVASLNARLHRARQSLTRHLAKDGDVRYATPRMEKRR